LHPNAECLTRYYHGSIFASTQISDLVKATASERNPASDAQISILQEGALMRRMKWIAVLAIFGVASLAACERKPEQAPATQEAPVTGQAPATVAPETAAAPGAAPSTGAAPEGTTPQMVAAGKQIYESNGICFTCHGMDAKGTALAPDLTSGKWLWVNPAQGNMLAQIEKVVKEGVPAPKEHPAPMPPMGGAQLTDEQIRDVSAYVLSISGGKS
jgi:mono/diheme cytochrome c family protein